MLGKKRVRGGQMKKFTQWTAAVVMVVLVCAPAFADTLVLKTGARVNGYFEGGTARVVKFRGADGVVKDYDILAVQQVQFGDTTPAPAANNSLNSPTPNTTSPQLRAPAERPS